MKTLIAFFIFAATAFAERPRMSDPSAGLAPIVADDGSVPVIANKIVRWLKDPDSVVWVAWDGPKVGRSPGGNPTWLVSVTYRAKNSYGAYNGNKTEHYWFSNGEPKRIFK